MRGPGDEPRQEIIIVRRGGDDDEEGHHGGAWKIAFADFMTAMMCFFLVMWLVNAANEDTRAAVASYFNPVKLMDRNTNRRGIDDLGDGPATERPTVIYNEPERDSEIGSRNGGDGSSFGATVTDSGEPRRSDQRMFSDPYAVLAEIAQDTGTLQNISARGDGGAQDSGPATGASGGESYRDPFAPDFWSSQIRSAPEDASTAHEPSREAVAAGEDASDEEAVAASPQPVPAPDEPDPFAAEMPATAAGAGFEPTRQPSAEDINTAQAASQARQAAQREQLAEDIREELASVFPDPRQLAGLSVTATSTGVLISIADALPEGMFEIGSAVPRRDLVLAMEKIGRMLGTHSGAVAINGHTDGRPFASDDYDNWRLSTARAHATYYMLVRGGLDEARVNSVAGFADRQLRLPDDPLASINRRIEIMLETQG